MVNMTTHLAVIVPTSACHGQLTQNLYWLIALLRWYAVKELLWVQFLTRARNQWVLPLLPFQAHSYTMGNVSLLLGCQSFTFLHCLKIWKIRHAMKMYLQCTLWSDLLFCLHTHRCEKSEHRCQNSGTAHFAIILFFLNLVSVSCLLKTDGKWTSDYY